jgi:hypothetical protein
MNRDDVIRMVGASKVEEIFVDMGDGRVLFSMSMEGLERFAQLVAAQAAAEEREACAESCDVPLDVDDWEVQCGAEGRQLCNDLARAIRARGTA